MEQLDRLCLLELEDPAWITFLPLARDASLGSTGRLVQARGLPSDPGWTPGQPSQHSWFTQGETESQRGSSVATATWVLESHFLSVYKIEIFGRSPSE